MGTPILPSMSITFENVCELLEKSEKIVLRRPRLLPQEEKARLQDVISQWFSHHRAGLDSSNTDGAAVLSIIFPHRRKDRVYGLQTKSLSKIIIDFLICNHGTRAVFESSTNGNHGDLGARLERILKSRDGTFRIKRAIPFEIVDDLLVQLAARCRFSDSAIQRRRDPNANTDADLKYILDRLESWETKWFVRLILRDYCTIELDENFVFGEYHFLLPDLLLFQNDFDAAFSLLRGELSCYPSIVKPASEKLWRIEAAKVLKAVVGIKVGRPTFHKPRSFKHCLQLTGNRAWLAEIKYDGEYCEVHINLANSPNDIQIFSKNGKDATKDRQALHGTIRKSLRVGEPGCLFKNKCIVLGELVVFSDKDQHILPFSKIRKHISRSGTFLGTQQDSPPHKWEHLMIVFFDVLALDDEPVVRSSLEKRRGILKELVQSIPGYATRSDRFLIDFKDEHGVTDLKQAFAKSLADRQEGLILKPLHAPYFPLWSELGHEQSGYFIKLKKDYLTDMGGERDLGDFAIIGASFDAQVAAKSDIEPLHWTHFHLGCLANKVAVEHHKAKPCFKVVGAISMDKCISKKDIKWLNIQGYVRQVILTKDGKNQYFDIERSFGYGQKMSVAFKDPFIVEVLGGGYDKVQNEAFEMLRHPRIKKIHQDRTWEDATTMEDLERMAKEKWEAPDADQLDGHAKDVAILVKEYIEKRQGSIFSDPEIESTQESTQCTTQRTSQETPQRNVQAILNDAVVQETPQISTQDTWATTSTTQCPGSTQGKGIRASKQVRVLVREDTSERLSRSSGPQLLPQTLIGLPTLSSSSLDNLSSNTKDRLLKEADIVSPPTSKRHNTHISLNAAGTKRRRIRTPLNDVGTKRNLGTFDYDSQERTIHIYAEEGWEVQVHHGC